MAAVNPDPVKYDFIAKMVDEVYASDVTDIGSLRKTKEALEAILPTLLHSEQKDVEAALSHLQGKIDSNKVGYEALKNLSGPKW